MDALPVDIPAIAGAATYSVAGVGVLAESAGLPFPGDALLLAVAAYASAGHLDVRLVVLIAAVAAMAGANLGYAAGYVGGRPFVERLGPRLPLHSSHLASAELLFARHGASALLIARFLGGTRVWASVLAGMAHMPVWRFQLWSAAGVALWTAVLVAAGHLVGVHWSQLERLARAGGAGGLVVAAAAAIAVLLMVRRTARV